MKIAATLTVDFEEVASAIQDHDEAFELIKTIDFSMADYEFTERVAKYLVQEPIKECSFSDEEFDIKELLK